MENFLKIAITHKMLLSDFDENGEKYPSKSLLASGKTGFFNIGCGKPMWKTSFYCGKLSLSCVFSVDFVSITIFFHIFQHFGFPHKAARCYVEGCSGNGDTAYGLPVAAQFKTIEESSASFYLPLMGKGDRYPLWVVVDEVLR